MCGSCPVDDENSLKKMWIGLGIWAVIFVLFYAAYLLLGGANATS